MGQTTLPGTQPLIGTYTCGHGFEHQVPSERVRICRVGIGFIGACSCGAEPLDVVADEPHYLAEHIALLPVTDAPLLWLALETIADGWWGDPDLEPLSGGPTSRETRRAYLEEMHDEAPDDTRVDLEALRAELNA